MNSQVNERGMYNLELESEAQLSPPSLYQVYIENDHETPMEFVIEMLEKFFNMDRWKATRVMLEAHTIGKGVCGVYSKDVAETKLSVVSEYTRKCDYPLICSMEAA